MQPFIIGITGGTASGKTTFVRELRQSFSADELCLVSQDNYYRPQTELQTDHNGKINYDLPTAFQAEDFARDIRLLQQGYDVTRKEYVFNNSQAQAQNLLMKSAPVILVEGLFVLHFENLLPLFNLRIYVHTPDHVALIRRIRRDQTERNLTLDDVLYQYEQHAYPAFEQYIKPQQERADLIINNQYNHEPALNLITAYIHRLISGR